MTIFGIRRERSQVDNMVYELLLAQEHASYLLRDALPGDPFYAAVQANFTFIERALEIGGVPANVSDDSDNDAIDNFGATGVFDNVDQNLIDSSADSDDD